MPTKIIADIAAFASGMVGAIPSAYAADSHACDALKDGCPPTSIDSLLSVFQGVANFLLDAIAGVSMFFIIWGGLLMIVSFGDESKFTTGRNSVLYACIGLAVALSADMFLYILTPIGAAGTFQQAALNILTIPIMLLNIIFSVVIVLTAFRLVMARGKSDEVEAARRMLIYAIIGAIVVNLSKAIYTAVANLFI